MRVLALGFLLSIAMGARASETPPVGIRGVVLDAETKKPIAGVRVTLSGPALPAEGVTVSTDASGAYALANVPPGVYTLRLEHERYRPFTVSNIRRRDHDWSRINVELIDWRLKVEIYPACHLGPIDVGSSSTGEHIPVETFLRNYPVQ